MLRTVAIGLRVIALVACAAGLVSGCSTKPRSAPVSDRSITSGQKAIPPATPAKPDGGTYTVKRGDTLRSIATQYGMDYRQLAALNGIDSPFQIRIDQVLRVTPDAPTPTSAGAVAQSTPIASGAIEQRALGAPSPETPSDAPVKTGPSGTKQPYSDATLAAMSAPDVTASGPAPTPAAVSAASAPALTADEDLGWIWPASGNVIAEFTKEGKGIDIAGKSGSPVLATADGTVIYVGGGANSLRGYGNLVIVKHNATFLSVYAHNSKNLVTENQAVKKGQKIAEMGDTDSDHVALHFEIRRQGTPVNPVKYLPAH